MPRAWERALLAATFCIASLLLINGVSAQTVGTVVPACGAGALAAPLLPGTQYPLLVDKNGTLCATSGSSVQSVTIVGPNGPEGGVSVSINPERKNAIVEGGAIEVGGSWTQIAPENLLRYRISVQNYCSAATQGIPTTESLFVAVSPAVPPSPLVTPGPFELVTCGGYDSSSAVVGTGPVWLWAATTGHRFAALEW